MSGILGNAGINIQTLYLIGGNFFALEVEERDIDKARELLRNNLVDA